MNSPLKIAHINKKESTDLSRILMDKWKRKQEKELEDYRSGKKKLITKSKSY